VIFLAQTAQQNQTRSKLSYSCQSAGVNAFDVIQIFPSIGNLRFDSEFRDSGDNNPVRPVEWNNKLQRFIHRPQPESAPFCFFEKSCEIQDPFSIEAMSGRKYKSLFKTLPSSR